MNSEKWKGLEYKVERDPMACNLYENWLELMQASQEGLYEGNC